MGTSYVPTVAMSNCPPPVAMSAVTFWRSVFSGRVSKLTLIPVDFSKSPTSCCMSTICGLLTVAMVRVVVLCASAFGTGAAENTIALAPMNAMTRVGVFKLITPWTRKVPDRAGTGRRADMLRADPLGDRRARARRVHGWALDDAARRRRHKIRTDRIVNGAGENPVDVIERRVIEREAHRAFDVVELRRLAGAPQRHADAGLFEHPANGEIDHPFAETFARERVELVDGVQILRQARLDVLGIAPVADVVAAEGAVARHAPAQEA